MNGQPKKYELLVRLKELDLSDKAMNALVALGEYERVTAPPNS